MSLADVEISLGLARPLDIVQKALLGGIPIIASVSTLAIDLARKSGRP